MSHRGKVRADQAADGQPAGSRPERSARRWGMGAVTTAVLALAGCTFTGNGLNTAGLDRIVVGRTTLAQASQDLGAQPTDTWQQGDTLLARWAYKGTVATDAVYARQEVWLRFGPDGTFQQMENSVNVPALRRPRTAAEADRAAAQQRAREQANADAAAQTQVDAAAQTQADAAAQTQADAAAQTQADAAAQAQADAAAQTQADGMIVIPGNGEFESIPVPAPPPVSGSGTDALGPQPLLPSGTQLVPGVSYPLPAAKPQ